MRNMVAALMKTFAVTGKVRFPDGRAVFQSDESDDNGGAERDDGEFGEFRICGWGKGSATRDTGRREDFVLREERGWLLY